MFNDKVKKTKVLTDEILVKDSEGFKVFKAGKIRALDSTSGRTSPSTLESLIPSSPKAKFYFDPEDEEEIAKFRAKTETLRNGPSINFNQLAKNIIQRARIRFHDELLARRLENVIKARLQDLRDAVETQEVLRRSTDLGGLAIDDKTTDSLVFLMEQEVKKFLKERKSDLTFLVSESKDFPEVQSRKSEIIGPKPPLTAAKTLPVKKVVKSAELAVKISKPAKSPVLAEERSKPRLLSVSSSHLTQLRPQSSPRPRLEDVKFKPRLVGPLEELSSFNLINFRRLHPVPQEAAQKIAAKIKLLAEESFAKKMAGLKAWRESAVFKAYLELGRQSLAQGKTIAEIIPTKETSLTLEEFKAISDLNQQLRY